VNEEDKPEPEGEEPFVVPRFKTFDSPFPLPLSDRDPDEFHPFRPNIHATLNEKHEVVPCRSLREWAEWMHAGLEKGDDRRRVAETTINGHWVSTVFLGIDHGFGLGPSRWFETMVFPQGEEPMIPELGGKLREMLKNMQLRYENWAEAKEGHETVVETIRHGLF
jgi:hypothetical protein